MRRAPLPSGSLLLAGRRLGWALGLGSPAGLCFPLPRRPRPLPFPSLGLRLRASRSSRLPRRASRLAWAGRRAPPLTPDAASKCLADLKGNDVKKDVDQVPKKGADPPPPKQTLPGHTRSGAKLLARLGWALWMIQWFGRRDSAAVKESLFLARQKSELAITELDTMARIIKDIKTLVEN